MRWRLMLQRDAMRELRQAGVGVGQALQTMATEPEPWLEDLAMRARPGRFERNSSGFWIGYEVDRAEGTLRIIYIQPNR